MIVEVSIGEAVDKATILSIKSEKIKDVLKLININKELSYLLDILERDYEITNTNELFVKLIKKTIDSVYGSNFSEEKSYKKYN